MRKIVYHDTKGNEHSTPLGPDGEITSTIAEDILRRSRMLHKAKSHR